MSRRYVATAVTTAWLGLGAALSAACGASAAASDGATTPAASDGRRGESSSAEPETQPEPKRARVHVDLELEDVMNVRDPGKDQFRVALVITDGSGEPVRHVLGVFSGVCAEAEAGVEEPGLPQPALIGADCRGGKRESRVRVVRDGSGVVALRAWIDEAEASAEFPTYEELHRYELAVGAEVVTGDPR